VACTEEVTRWIVRLSDGDGRVAAVPPKRLAKEGIAGQPARARRSVKRRRKRSRDQWSRETPP
jgi:hypothetical protein